MQLLHVRRTFSALSETFIYDHICELERRGVTNHVATFARENAETRPFPRVHLLTEASTVRRASLFRRVAKKVGLYPMSEPDWPRQRDELSRLVERIEPDVIHAHFGPMGVLVAPVAERHGIPLIVTFHGFDATRYLDDPTWRRRYRRFWPVPALIAGVSDHICRRLMEAGAPPSKVRKIGNGVRLDDFAASPPARRFDGYTVHYLFVGRLVEKKAPLLLLQSFLRAQAKLGKRRNLFLHVVGDGPLRHSVQEFVKSNHLEANVQIHGALPHSQVQDLLRKCHCYVQHSVKAANGDEEGQPVSLIEAAASAIPIVSTRHSGIPEVVINGTTGYLVDEHDIDAMAERIAFIAEHPEVWDGLGTAGRDHARLTMNLETQVSAWEDIYREISKRHNACGGAEDDLVSSEH